MAHPDHCLGFAAVFGDLIVATSRDDEAIGQQPYALSDGRRHAPIAYCPFCGQFLSSRFINSVR